MRQWPMRRWHAQAPELHRQLREISAAIIIETKMVVDFYANQNPIRTFATL